MSSRAELVTRELTRIDGVKIRKEEAKYQKMALSPFVFYRGSAQLFYADIASGTLLIPNALKNLPLTCVMGDCHASNFGFLTEEGSHGGSVIFSPNDFDDACIGRPEWDLLRFSTSLALTTQHCRLEADATDEVVTQSQVEQGIESFLKGYLSICELGLNGQEHRHMAMDRSALENFSILSKPFKKAQRRAIGGEQFHLKSTLAKAIKFEGTSLSFKDLEDKFLPLDDALYQELADTFAPYMDDYIWDIVARKNAGTGSVNMSRYYFLIGPKDYKGLEDLALCHLVEVKKQREAAPIYFFPGLSPNNRLNPAHLTIMCQRKMQRFPDLVLDEVEWQNEYWLVRSRHHAKVGIDPEDIALGKKAALKGGFIDYAVACGKALALAHCRGDKRSLAFEESVVLSLPTCIDEIKLSSLAYAKQVTEDWLWLKDQIRT